MIARRLMVGTLLLGSAALASSPTAAAAWIGLVQGGLTLPTLFLRARRAPDAWRTANLAVLLSAAILISVRVPLLVVVAGVLAWLGVHRAWTAQRTEALQIGAALAALEGLLCARLGAPPGLDLAASALLFLAPLAAAVAHTPRWQPALAGGLAGSAGLLAAALMLVPAPTAPLPDAAADGPLAGGGAAVGFAREISLGALAPLHSDLSVVAQVTAEGLVPGEVYLHGVVLDRFAGQVWSATAAARSMPPAVLPTEPGALLRQQIELAPLTGGVLLGLAPVVAVHSVGTVPEGSAEALVAWQDAFGTWRYTGAVRPVRYRVSSLRAPTRGLLSDRARWLGLPADLDPEVRSLAARLAAQAPADRAARAAFLVGWLRENYTYTRIPRPETARQALSAFLFESRAGHCEYFATALAVLLRAQGIEARVVSGLRGGEAGPDGTVVFRQRDAHAWVEMFTEEAGWVRLDATPPELRALSDASAAAAAEVVAAAAAAGDRRRGGRVALAVGAVLLTGVGLLVWGLSRRRPQVAAVERCWRQARRLVQRRGWAIPPGLPPVAAGAWLTKAAGPGGAPLEALAWQLYRHRYGQETVPPAEARATLQALRRALPSARRRLTGAGRRVN